MFGEEAVEGVYVGCDSKRSAQRKEGVCEWWQLTLDYLMKER